MSKDPNSGGSSRRWIIRACEDSLRRLGTDYLDIYQAHRPDPDTDVDETMYALSDLVQEGQVRLLGTSTFPVDMIVEMPPNLARAQRNSMRRSTFRGVIARWWLGPHLRISTRCCSRIGLGFSSGASATTK
jgi:hypothetical protein